VLLLLACSDASGPATPRTGAIRVSLALTGTDFPAVYTIFVAGRSVSAQATAPTVIDGLLPSQYPLTIVLVRNCQLTDANTPTASVVAGETTAVTVSAKCDATTGSLLVTTATTGVDLDPDGYLLRVDGVAVDGSRYQQIWRLDANGAQTLSRVPMGTISLALSGLALNCEPVDTTPHTVAVQPAEATTVAFRVSCAPNDSQLAFVIDSGLVVRHIYLSNLNATGVRRLNVGELSSDEDPAWSPDGSKIAFTTDRDGNKEIYVASVDGSNPVRLTSNSAADYEPTWSPNGARIAFVSTRAGSPDIFTMSVDGSNVTRLTITPGVEADPAWSADGRIAFASDRDGPANIYVMNADGSGVTRLTSTGGDHPAWSPDGTKLAYSTTYCPFYYCGPSIYIVSGTDAAPANVGSGRQPAWSPDGRKIAFEGLECDFYYITCNPAGIRIARLASPDVILSLPGYDPAWRP
jgi:TolB protein